MDRNSTGSKSIVLILLISILLMSCTSTTLIQSTPSGAKVYIDGQFAGTTPYSYTDTKIVGSATNVKLEKKGFNTLNATFSRSEQVDVGAVIGGFFVWIPFLWIMKYNPTHMYELVESSVIEDTKSKSPEQPKTKPERLRELKQLLDEKIITQEEFEKEKKKILEEGEK